MDEDEATNGRSIEDWEVALIRRMALRKLKRDYIHSFFVRPGRKLSPGRISEIDQRKYAPEIDPASDDETDDYIARRIAETSAAKGELFDSPVSSIRLNGILRGLMDYQHALFRDETQFVEYKSAFISDKRHLLGYSKTLCAFANFKGGHIFFGIETSGRVCGVDPEEFEAADWDQFTSICKDYFQPSFRWDRTIHLRQGKHIGVLYAYEEEVKPIIAVKTHSNVICEGSIYFRYRGQSEPIKPLDLERLLRDRDDQVRSRATRQ